MLKSIWQRKLPTAAHIKAWQSFNHLMNCRMYITMINLFFQAIVWDIVGNSYAERSEKYVKSDDFMGNRELAQEIWPYASVIHTTLNFGRPLVILLCIWKPQICNYMHQYQMILFLAKELMPLDTGSTHLFCMLVENFVILILFSHYIWLDYISATAAISFVALWVRTFLYNDNHGLAKLASSFA